MLTSSGSDGLSITSIENILDDMERRANFLSTAPKPTPSQEEEVIERPGERVVRKRTISREPSEKIPGEGDLK